MTKVKENYVYNTYHADYAIIIYKIQKNLNRVLIKFYRDPDRATEKHPLEGYFKLSEIEQLQLELDVIKTMKYRKALNG